MDLVKKRPYRATTGQRGMRSSAGSSPRMPSSCLGAGAPPVTSPRGSDGSNSSGGGGGRVTGTGVTVPGSGTPSVISTPL
eukprot:11214271-Lingulodinium_polyedra.AAC.2